MQRLSSRSIPVAYSMISAAREIKDVSSKSAVFNKYFFYWTAFNNIYSQISFEENERTALVRNPDGTVKTTPNGNVQIPKVRTVSERRQIELAFERFDEELKDILISHFATRFFVYRTPKLNGQKIEADRLGQKLNGVLNLHYTVDETHPVWSPIDFQNYRAYLADRDDRDLRTQLSKQILELLYTVRCNLMHGGKSVTNENDTEVVTYALLLLEMIVSAFTGRDSHGGRIET